MCSGQQLTSHPRIGVGLRQKKSKSFFFFIFLETNQKVDNIDTDDEENLWFI